MMAARPWICFALTVLAVLATATNRTQITPQPAALGSEHSESKARALLSVRETSEEEGNGRRLGGHTGKFKFGKFDGFGGKPGRFGKLRKFGKSLFGKFSKFGKGTFSKSGKLGNSSAGSGWQFAVNVPQHFT
mmetsp:Transcript_27816/g.88414  ORF Transcript_27816/g.88414 Transcript_27816/m.88414 type:complete len:133 (+) Transcript_27816:69-467(+)